MLQRTPPEDIAGNGRGYLISDGDIDNARIALLIIGVVFALQLGFSGLALLIMRS